MSKRPQRSMVVFPFCSMEPSEAAESAARQDPSDLHGGRDRKIVWSAQEYGANLAEIRAGADR